MSFWDSIFGGKSSNPANAAMPYLNQIPGQTMPYLQPWFNAGMGALPGLQDQYGQLTNDPSKRLNEIGQGYKESPGLQFAIQKALGAQGRAAAAGGMAGSPQHQEYNTELATNYANQDYNNYMQNALGLYKSGLGGQQGLAQMGQQSGQSMADMIAQMLAQQGNLAFQGQAQNNQNRNDLLGFLGKGAGALSAFTPWGQAGGAFDTAYNRMFGGH
jgi:hypothetical protein